LERGKLVDMLLDQISELVEQSAPLARRYLFPWPALECPARRSDGSIHVVLAAFGHSRDDFARCRIDGFKGSSAHRIHPLAVDQHFRLTHVHGWLVERLRFKSC